MPRSHCASDTFFGPRASFHITSPRASHSSAGLPSASASRYSWICAEVSLARACRTPGSNTSTAAAIARVEILAMVIPPAARSRDRRFVGALLAAVVDPCDDDLVALVATLEAERQERIFGNGRAPLRGQHRPARAGDVDALDEPGGDHLALRVLALAGFHLVAHQNLDFRRVAQLVGANLHRIWHGWTLSLVNDSERRRRGARWRLPARAYQPPQPPSVTLISLDAT